MECAGVVCHSGFSGSSDVGHCGCPGRVGFEGALRGCRGSQSIARPGAEQCVGADTGHQSGTSGVS